jgi:hypothetical protein
MHMHREVRRRLLAAAAASVWLACTAMMMNGLLHRLPAGHAATGALLHTCAMFTIGQIALNSMQSPCLTSATLGPGGIIMHGRVIMTVQHGRTCGAVERASHLMCVYT